MDRSAAIDRVDELLDAVETDPMPVPVREVWVYGDVALGLDPVERLDVYLTKDIVLRDDPTAEVDRAGDGATDDGDGAGSGDPAIREAPDDPKNPEAAFLESHGVKGVGKSVSSAWAREYPEHLRASDSGYAAPEKCLAAHLLEPDEPIHLEVCNASFDDNVTQRLRGALARDAYEEILDPRGVCLWVDGRRSEEALSKLRGGELPFPTLSAALEMLGADEETAAEAAAAMREYRARQTGRSVRGDVV